jgi:hypothetical protein
MDPLKTDKTKEVGTTLQYFFNSQRGKQPNSFLSVWLMYRDKVVGATYFGLDSTKSDFAFAS